MIDSKFNHNLKCRVWRIRGFNNCAKAQILKYIKYDKSLIIKYIIILKSIYKNHLFTL